MKDTVAPSRLATSRPHESQGRMCQAAKRPLFNKTKDSTHLNSSARVKNTNCPFQMIVKIDVKGQCYVDVEWEHNHSVETLVL